MGCLWLENGKQRSQQRKEKSHLRRNKRTKKCLVRKSMEDIFLKIRWANFMSLPANHHLAVLFSSLYIFFFYSISLCEGLIFKSLAEKTGFKCSPCYENIMFYAFEKSHFFSYEIYLYSFPKS